MNVSTLMESLHWGLGRGEVKKVIFWKTTPKDPKNEFKGPKIKFRGLKINLGGIKSVKWP